MGSDEEKKVALVPDSAVSKPQKKLEAGQIHITVIKARDIEKKGNFGKADPYVKITLGNQKAKSATVKNNHNPEWNFEAIFEIDENISEGVNIAVFDDDFGKDDSLGNKTLDIHSIQEHRQMLNQWIPLENCKSGEVLLSAEFLPHGSVQKSKGIESKPDSTKEVLKQIEPTVKDTVEVKVQDSTITKEIVEEYETAKIPEKVFVSETKEKTQVIVKDLNVTESVVTSPTPTKLFEAGQLLLTVFKARDIEKKGNFGKADPYVKITLDKQKAKSATVKNNHNPEWNFKAAFDINESTTENITIAVFDDDFGKDDSLGNAIVDISKVQEQKRLLNQWIPLKKCKSGEVLISAEFIPQALVQKEKELEPLKTIEKNEDIKQIKEITKQEIHLESSKEEVLITKNTESKIVQEKGAQGLKEVLNKKSKVSSEISASSDDSTEVVTQKSKALEPGQIKITVHKARDIEKRGMFGKADPYVILTHGDQKAKSKTIKNNYNPEWDFTAKFDIKQEATEGITISVFDNDIGKDDALGQKILDISALQEYQNLKNQWIPLENCKTGEVLISAEFVPLALVEKSIKVEKSLDSTPVKEATKESKAHPKDTEDDKLKDSKLKQPTITENEKTIGLDSYEETLQGIDLHRKEIVEVKVQDLSAIGQDVKESKVSKTPESEIDTTIFT